MERNRNCLFKLLTVVAISLTLATLVSAANVSKLVVQCTHNNAQACEDLKHIATNQKEKTANRVAAIRAVNDDQILSALAASTKNVEIERAARAKLQEVLSSEFLHAVSSGNIDDMKNLAARGVKVDVHNDALEIRDLQAINGGYQYRVECRNGAAASQAMLIAIGTGRVEIVQALIDLGSSVNGEYVMKEAILNTGPISPLIARSSACAGLSIVVAPLFYMGANGVTRSTTPPLSRRPAHI
ncbi:MAG: hypothetical protein WCC87_18210 [Candidatus Korobacteraceae bacterium]